MTRLAPVLRRPGRYRNTKEKSSVWIATSVNTRKSPLALAHYTTRVVVDTTEKKKTRIVSDLLSEIIKSQNLFLNENFIFNANQNTFLVEKLVQNRTENGFLVTEFSQIKPFAKMILSHEARRIQYTPNAGGSSVESETLSYEILSKYFNAKLLKTEMEVVYFPEGGSITDYVVSMFDTIVGVSVTRAMKFDPTEVFTSEDAHVILRKKLRGIRQSSKNTMVKWSKQILHVWVFDERIVDTLALAWNEIENELRANTVLMVTVAKRSREIFVNNEKKAKLVKKRHLTV